MARVLVIAVTATLLLGVLVKAGRADGEREIIFRTPSGTIVCDSWSLGRSVTDNKVVCALLSSKIHVTYQCPDVGVGCPLVYTLDPNNPVEVERSSSSIHADRTLSYGRALTNGYLTCVSRMTGLTCTSLRSKHGFFLSRQAQRTW